MKITVLFTLLIFSQELTNDENKFLIDFYRSAVMTSAWEGHKNVQYVGKDTAIGMHIEYRYYKDGNPEKCFSLELFGLVDSIQKYRSIYALLENNVFSDQTQYLTPTNIINNEQFDTLYYNKNPDFFIKEVLAKVKASNKQDGYYYRISENEFIRYAEATAVVDVIKGDDKALSIYNPLYKISDSTTPNIVFYHYRKILNYEFKWPKMLFGVNKQRYKKYKSSCTFSIH